jgi:hypothetical protein
MAVVGPVVIAVGLGDLPHVGSTPHPLAAGVFNVAFVGVGIFCLLVARRLLWPETRISLLSPAGWKRAAGVFSLVGFITAAAAAWQGHAAVGIAVLLSCAEAVRWSLRASNEAALKNDAP